MKINERWTEFKSKHQISRFGILILILIAAVIAIPNPFGPSSTNDDVWSVSTEPNISMSLSYDDRVNFCRDNGFDDTSYGSAWSKDVTCVTYQGRNLSNYRVLARWLASENIIKSGNNFTITESLLDVYCRQSGKRFVKVQNNGYNFECSDFSSDVVNRTDFDRQDAVKWKINMMVHPNAPLAINESWDNIFNIFLEYDWRTVDTDTNTDTNTVVIYWNPIERKSTNHNIVKRDNITHLYNFSVFYDGVDIGSATQEEKDNVVLAYSNVNKSRRCEYNGTYIKYTYLDYEGVFVFTGIEARMILRIPW